MKLTVNGEAQEVPASMTVAGLLAHLQIAAPRVAVELNRAIVPRAQHAEQALSDGDQVEIVTFVGGG